MIRWPQTLPLLLATGVTMSLCAGCAPAPDDTTLVIAIPAEPEALLPPVATGPLDAAMADLLLTPLAPMGWQGGPVSQPGLARVWAWEGETLTMTLAHRRWSDGRPVRAQDVAISAALTVDPRVGSVHARLLDGLLPDGAPEVLDDDHIAWHFATPGDHDQRLAHIGGLAALPAHRLLNADPAALRANPLNREPLADGPWVLSAWEPGERLVLRPNPEWSPTPSISQIVFRVLPERATALIALETGGVDLVSDVDVHALAHLMAERPDLRVVRRGWRAAEFIAWNERAPGDATAPHPIFGDRRVRRALAQAIDVQRLITDLLTDPATGTRYGRAMTSTLSPSLGDDGIAALAFDPPTARALLSQAGWQDSDGDGVLDKDGHALSFSLMVSHGRERREQAAVLVQAMLADVGAQVQIQSVDRGVLRHRRKEGDFDAYLSGITASLAPDPRLMWASDGPLNAVGFSDPQVDRLLATPGGAGWPQARQQIYEDQPWAFLYWRDELVVLDGALRDATIDMVGPWRELWRWRYAR